MTKFFTFILYSFLAVFVFFMGAREPNLDGYDRAMYVDMVYGKAHKPFVYRTMLPSTVRLISTITPNSLKSALKSVLDKFYPVDKAFDKMSWQKEYWFEYLTGFVLMIASLAGFMYALKYLILLLFDTKKYIAIIMPAAAIFGVPALISYYVYPYDYPVLFLFTLGLAFMVNRKFTVYYVVFILACINKETAVLLPFVYFLYYYLIEKDNRKYHLKNLMIQIIIFIFIKVFITIIFYGNTGGFVEFHLFDKNFDLFYKPYPVYALVSFVVMLILIFYKWKDKPLFIRRAIWMAAPIFILSLFWGVLNEVRVYFEVYPVIALCIGHTFAKLTGLKFDTK